jgi:hypothetical protein
MEHHGTFGQDAFGRGAEHAARFCGTPQYIVGQTIVVILWIGLNAAGSRSSGIRTRSSCSTSRSRRRRRTRRR